MKKIAASENLGALRKAGMAARARSDEEEANGRYRLREVDVS